NRTDEIEIMSGAGAQTPSHNGKQFEGFGHVRKYNDDQAAGADKLQKSPDCHFAPPSSCTRRATSTFSYASVAQPSWDVARWRSANLPCSMVTSRVIGCGSGFIGPTTIAFTQALNPRPAIRWGRETATAVGWAVNSVSPPTRIISLTSGSASGA